MLLSNKLTLCLTFFILLAFVAVPVMAHPPGANVPDHGHPSAVDSGDGYTDDVDSNGTTGDYGNTRDTNDDGDTEDTGESIALHNAHPRVVSITLKAATNVRGTTAAIVADDATTNDVAENAFTLVVDFDRDIVGANNLAEVPAFSTADPPVLTEGAQLETADFTSSLLNVDNTTAAGGGASFVINRVSGDDSKYEIVVTIAADSIPNADADAATANDNTLTFRIRVNAFTDTNGVYSLQTTVIRSDSVTPVTIPGGGNFASDVYSFSLVSALPDLPGTSIPPDTDSPTITAFEDAVDGTNLKFTVTFSESLGRSGILPSHLMITGGTLVAGTTDAPNPKDITPDATADDAPHMYEILVTPTGDLDETEVTVTIIDGTVADLEGNHYREPETGVMMGRYDTVNPTVNEVAGGPPAPVAAGPVTLKITFSEKLGGMVGQAGPNFTNDDIDRTNSNVLLTSTEPVLAMTPEGNETVYELTVTPVPANAAQVVIVIKESSIADVAGNELENDTIVTWTRPSPPSGDTTKPVVMLQNPKGADAASANEGPADDVVIDDSGGSITFSISDTGGSGLAANTAVEMSEVSVSNGTVVSVSGNMITVNPVIADGANVNTTVTVTVAAGAIADVAGNMSDAVSATYSIGPIFSIPMNTILVITKTAGATHTYLSDQPRLPLNQDPPTPATNIETAVWRNMPDLEVLFSFAAGGNGGTLSLIEANRQGELGQSRDGGNGQHQSVRISEVMWASDLRFRGADRDAEAAEQWVEITNNTGSAVRVLLYARTGLDSAINIDNNAEDRVGNAYNGSRGSAGWNISEANSGKGQSGNSWTGVNFVSMHRKWDGAHNRGYVNGTSSGHWSASDREYLTLISGNGEKLYDHVGSPGRPHGIGLPKPSTKAGVTQVPSSPFIINEVANRDSGNSEYEWIEIKNVTDSRQNLRNYLISMVEKVGDANPTDTVLLEIDNKDYWVEGGDVILLLASDPRYDDDHPIAPGYNVDVNPNDQVDGLGINNANDDDEKIFHDVRSKRRPVLQKVTSFKNGGLPDGGDFILILRKPDNYEGHRANVHGGKGVAETSNFGSNQIDVDKIVDIAGSHTRLDASNYPSTNPSGLNITTLWPLVNFNGDMRPHYGHGNLGHRRHNRLEVNRVRYRQHVKTTAKNDHDGGTPGNRAGTGVTHKNEEVGHYAFRDAIYTGLGYRRTARADRSYNHGTPGYDGNSVGNTGIVKATAADAKVTISEIMSSMGPNADNPVLPQWIELYNSSRTDAVNLRGWKLRFETLDENGDPMDSLIDLNFNSSRSVKTIQPQQTVLIVAGNAKQANSDSATGIDVFNENRVFNVYRDIGAGKFGANTRYMFFNPKAFSIALLDKDNKVVDQIGNLDGDARTSDTNNWDFPMGVAADDNRTSFIRIYDDGVARDGMNTAESNVQPMFKEGGKLNDTEGIDAKYSWIPAVNTERDFKITIKSTWYGDEDDYGTPNHRRGLVLPVELSFFRPTLEDGVVTVRWTTESELDNAGFNIYRSETRDGEYKQVNTELIEGAGTTGERTVYSWVDQTAKPGVVYYYQIEDVSFAGDRQALAVTKLKGLISAKNKLTTTWSELKEASQ